MATPHHLLKKRGALKSTKKYLFFDRPNFPGLAHLNFWSLAVKT